MRPQRFRRKPVEIEAMLYTRETRDDVIAWSGATGTVFNEQGAEYETERLTIHTLEGDHQARLGDWVIKGIKGEFYPCKPDIFRDSYEEVTS